MLMRDLLVVANILIVNCDTYVFMFLRDDIKLMLFKCVLAGHCTSIASMKLLNCCVERSRN